MPIQISAPSGDIVEFPDGTPDDVIEKAMANEYGGGTPSTFSDMAKGFGTGIVQGAIGVASMPQDLGNWLGDKVGYGIDRLMGKTPEEAQATSDKAKALKDQSLFTPPSGAGITSAIEGVTGPMYQAKTVPGQFAQTTGQFVPGMLMGPGSWGQRIVNGVSAALGSETAGQATKGSWVEPYARLGGALLGGIAPNVSRRAVTPFPVNQERQRLLGIMDQEGVNLTAGQRTGSDNLGYMESELGGGATRRMMEQQGEQFTAAALRRAGIDAPRATPEVINQAFNRIGNEFDTLAARNVLPPDPTIATDVANAVTDYAALVPATAQPNAVRQYANDLLNAAQNGMTGAQYQSFRSRLTTLARNSSDPQLSQLYRSFAEALDDGMERNLATNGSPDLGAWQDVRNQYRNMLVIEQAATASGKNTAEGLIQPSQLRNATVQRQGRRNYARGQGDFADLARAGEATMKPLPNSGTTGRMMARAAGATVPTILGTVLGGASGLPGGQIIGGLLGSAVPFLEGRVLMSRPVQTYLGNQMLLGRGLPVAGQTVIPLLGTIPQISGPR